MEKILYLDFDGTVVNSKKRMSEIYNRYYLSEHDSPIDYKNITTWSAGISDRDIVEDIFGHPEFHNDELEIFEDAIETLSNLKRNGWKIILYTKGIMSNIHFKAGYCEEKLGHLLDGWIFTGSENVPMGKSMYDMSPQNKGDITILLDDHIENLDNSGALYNICAKLCGLDEEWNRDWYERAITHWKQLELMLDGIEAYEQLIDSLK